MIKLNNEDYNIFEEIEKQRENIINKNSILNIIDYGAGSPVDTRTKEEMYIGNKVKTSTSDMCKIGLKNNWAEFMYQLIKTHKPNHILELGTCCGFSSIYMSKANTSSKIFTIEGSEELAKVAQENRDKLNCNNVIQKIGKFQDILIPVLEEIQNVDFAFIDGHHDKDATIEYFNIIKPFLNKNAIIVFDDISWSDGMQEAWQKIIKDKDIIKYEDMKKLGICYL